MKKDDILAALPGLTVTDLKALQTLIGALLAEKVSTVSPAQNSQQALLFEALRAALDMPQGYTAFVNTPAGCTFNKNAPVMLAFIENTFKGAANWRKAARLAGMRWLFDLLTRSLRDSNIPVTRNTLCEAMVRMPEVFEHAYPDYIKSGLGAMLLFRATGITLVGRETP